MARRHSKRVLAAFEARVATDKKRAIAKGFRWIYIGGGTLIGATSRYPCDFSYENMVTGRLVRFKCTSRAYFARFPDYLKTLRSVRLTPGVKEIKP